MGGWFNIKMLSYQYRKSYCGYKTILRSSYIHNGISDTGKMTFWYWNEAQACIKYCPLQWAQASTVQYWVTMETKFYVKAQHECNSGSHWKTSDKSSTTLCKLINETIQLLRKLKVCSAFHQMMLWDINFMFTIKRLFYEMVQSLRWDDSPNNRDCRGLYRWDTETLTVILFTKCPYHDYQNHEKFFHITGPTFHRTRSGVGVTKPFFFPVPLFS